MQEALVQYKVTKFASVCSKCGRHVKAGAVVKVEAGRQVATHKCLELHQS